MLSLPALSFSQSCNWDVQESCFSLEDITDCREGADPCTESCTSVNWVRTSGTFYNYTLEFRIGGYYPSNSRIHKVYGDGVDYEIEWTRLGALNWTDIKILQCLDFWVNASYVSLHGHYGDYRQKTRLQMYPISFGFKHEFHLTENFSFYAGFGGSYTFLKLGGRALFENGHSQNKGWGVVGKSGLLYKLWNGIFLDYFLDYSYTGISGGGSTVDFGGMRTGLGVGFGF